MLALAHFSVLVRVENSLVNFPIDNLSDQIWFDQSNTNVDQKNECLIDD